MNFEGHEFRLQQTLDFNRDVLRSSSSCSVSFLSLLNFQWHQRYCFHFITSYSLLNLLQSDFTLIALLKLLIERAK